MAIRIALWALALVGSLLLTTNLRADEQTGRPLVVIVGISKYHDPQIKSRRHAEADARALYDLVVSKDHLGVDPKDAKLLLGSGQGDQAATKKNIEDALHWLEKNAKKDDLVLLAIIGNGAPLGERSCYFGVDSTFKNRAKDAIASGDIEHIIEKLHSERFVAMVDVHFMNFDAGKEKAPEPNLSNFYREFLSQGDESKDISPSRVAFIAGSAVKGSLDLDKHGVFTQALLDGLNGQADSFGYEADGNITVSELAKYMRKAVPDLARAAGVTKEQKEQKSGVLEAQASDFIVAYNPKGRANSLNSSKKFETLAKSNQLDGKLIDEGKNLLVRMPKLEAQQNLRKAYQAFILGKYDVASLTAERKSILDATTLSDVEAGNYATTIIRAADLVRKAYYKDVVKAPMIGHAVTGMFKGIEEKVPADFQDRIDNIKELKDVALFKLLADARKHLGKREDLAKGQDLTNSLNGMLGKLDKHTGYIPPEVVRSFRTGTSGTFKGIGVQIRRNESRDQLQVVTPIFNSPAHKAGLRADDIITTIISEVDPETGDAYPKPIVTPTKGLTTEDAVKKILGKPGTRIKLKIERSGAEKEIEYTLIRGTINVESVLGAKRNDKGVWDYVIDPDNRICYIRLTQFSDNSYGELKKTMETLSKEGGVKGFVLDLRFNPGGLLDSSIKISDLFIDDGMVVSVRHRDGTETSYVGRAEGSYLTFPMVCLINSGSASASEIVSACLQDHGRAIIMGSRSFGKGSVQTIHGFDNQSIIKLTTATFWRPSGRNLNKSSTGGKDTDEWGVTPNKGFDLKLSKKEENELFDHLREIEIIRSGAPPTPAGTAKTEFRDRQLDMALEYLRGQIRTAARKDAKRDIENR